MASNPFAPRLPPTAHAFTVAAHCSRRWRGPSFDAYDAEARLGLALAEAVGVDVRDKAAMDRFTDGVMIRSERASVDTNPETPFDPEEGEAWAFHVRLRDPVPEDVLARAKDAAVVAVNAARHFSGARVTSA